MTQRYGLEGSPITVLAVLDERIGVAKALDDNALRFVVVEVGVSSPTGSRLNRQ
jgi:hypothetical protein